MHGFFSFKSALPTEARAQGGARNLVKYQRILGHPCRAGACRNLVKHQRILGIPQISLSAILLQFCCNFAAILLQFCCNFASVLDALSSALDALSSALDALSSALDALPRRAIKRPRRDDEKSTITALVRWCKGTYCGVSR